MNIAVIPARGGSKRLPLKNLKFFEGKPLIAWSIEAAVASKCFDRIIVSTDHDDIADVAVEFGAEVPFRRPLSLSGDHIPTIPVVAHALEAALGDAAVDYVCCIYATAPFIEHSDLRNGLELLKKGSFDYVVPVTTYPYPIQRALCLNESGRLQMIDAGNVTVRSQDLVEAYHDAGQFYWGRRDAWIRQQPILSTSSAPLIIPRHRVQDIDTLEDFERAELLFRALRQSEPKKEMNYG